ncbi:hypothetical protein D3C87_1213890 [compost metagenome]
MRGTQGAAAAYIGGRVLLVGDVLLEPGVQLALQILSLLPAADLFALQHFDVVGKTVDDKQVRQLGAELVVGLGFLAFAGLGEVFRFLHRVRREERRVVAVFTHGQRDEPGFSQLELLAIGNQYFGRNLGLQLAEGLVQMHRQIIHRATGLRANDVRTPAVAGEAVGDPRSHQERGVAPQVTVVVAVNGFVIAEAAGRVVVSAVRRAQQETRQGQGQMAGIFGFTQAAPFGVAWAVKNVADFLEVGQALETFQIEQFRASRRDKRCMGHGTDGGHIAEQLDVWRTGAKGVVADDGANGLTTKLAVAGGVDVLIQTATGDVAGIVEVVQ